MAVNYLIKSCCSSPPHKYERSCERGEWLVLRAWRIQWNVRGLFFPSSSLMSILFCWVQLSVGQKLENVNCISNPLSYVSRPLARYSHSLDLQYAPSRATLPVVHRPAHKRHFPTNGVPTLRHPFPCLHLEPGQHRAPNNRTTRWSKSSIQ